MFPNRLEALKANQGNVGEYNIDEMREERFNKFEYVLHAVADRTSPLDTEKMMLHYTNSC